MAKKKFELIGENLGNVTKFHVFNISGPTKKKVEEFYIENHHLDLLSNFFYKQPIDKELGKFTDWLEKNKIKTWDLKLKAIRKFLDFRKETMFKSQIRDNKEE